MGEAILRLEAVSYTHLGIAHYCLDHSPSLFYRSASEFISEKTALFIKPLVLETEDGVLEEMCIRDRKKYIQVYGNVTVPFGKMWKQNMESPLRR